MPVPGDVTAGVKRRLAAVFSADVEGFSRLCGEEEAGTLRVLEEHIDQLIKPVVRAHKGRITNRAGDELVAEFKSAVAAVKAAMEIQAGMAVRNAPVDPKKRLRFRIGLNLCEVVVSDGGIYGDGVNVAARAQAQAQPGSICATEAVVGQVRGKVAAEFHSMGRLKLKNIAEPVHLFRLDPAASKENEADETVRSQMADAGPKPSIAVLPFLNLSGDPDQGYFSDGIAEDLITDLSRFRTVSVIARNSSFGYRGGNVDVRKVANELGVRFVVEGSVRKMQDSVRTTVQLVNAETRAHIWAERYDTPLADLFRMQDEIIRRIIGNLVPKMEVEGLAIARRQPTELLQAYDYFLRGKAALYAATDAPGTEQARLYFEQAVEADPSFAQAYCYLVMILNTLTLYVYPGRPPEPFRAQAWNFASKAAALDDADPHTHTCIAWCHLWRGEFDQARRHIETAEQLNPNDADRAMDCGLAWVYLGDIEAAFRCMELGMRLNPRPPGSYLADMAEAHFVARRYDQAIELMERVPDQSPLTAGWKAAALASSGDMARAKEEAARFVSNLKTAWVGAPGAGVPEYVGWLMSFSPFYREEDRSHLMQGLQLAGLQLPA